MTPRPGGVTAIAILEFIGAGLLTLLGIALALGSSFAGILLGSASQKIGGGVLAALGIGVAIFLWVLAAVYIFVGNGMLKLKNWARVVTLVFAALSAFTALGGFFLSHGLLFMSLFRLAIAGLVIWYLLQPNVKAAFGVTGSGL